MRKLGIVVIVIVALIVIAALLIPSVVNVNQYHDRIQAELQKRLGRRVSLGQMHLSILPLAFRVDNGVVGEDPGFHSDRPFAQAQELDVSVKLLPLLHKDVQVKSLVLRKPQIELIRNAQGEWNFSTLGKPGTQVSGPAPQPAPGTPPAQPQPRQPEQPAQNQPGQTPAIALAELKVQDGQLGLTDQQKNQPRAVYNHIDLELKNFAPNQPFDIEVAAHLPGTGAQTIALAGRGGPIDQSNPINTPFDGTLKLNQVSLSAAQKFVNSQALSGTDGTASGSMKIHNDKGSIHSDGSIKLENARIHNLDIGYPISAVYNISDDLANDLLRIDKGSLKLGSTPLEITGTLNLKPTPAQLDVKLNASNVSIAEAARLASASGVAFNPGMQVNGRLSADVSAKGAANHPALNGSITARDFAISGKDVPQPVSVKAIDLNMTPDAIQSNNFTASAGSTAVNAQFTLSHYTTANPAVDVTLRTGNAHIDELLNIAKAYGVSAANGMSGTGIISLDVHATGPVKNASAMNFSGSGAVQNATLHLPQITRPVGVRNANLKFTQNTATLDNLSVSLADSNLTGNASVRNFSAPQVQFTLAADKINVTEMQQMFSSGTPQQQKRASRWSLVPQAYAATAPPGIVTQMTGGGTLTIGTVLYDQLVLTNARANVTLDRGVVRLNPVTAQLYGGQEAGDIVIDMRPTPMTYTVNSKLSNVDANKLLSAVSSVKQTLYGLLAASTNAHFTATSSDQIARTLNGTIGIDLRNGKIAGLDLLNELSRVGQFAGFNHAATNFTNVAQLTGNFNVQNGVATTNNLKAVIDGGTLAAAGAVNLADQTINMKLTAVLSQGMSKTVGGTSIGGFMNTALANNRGELVIPVLVTGSLQHPTITPDLQSVAQMKLKNLLPTTANPANPVQGILGALGGGAQGGQQGGVGGILGALTGQQQQQPQQRGVGQNQPPPPQQQQQQQQKNPLGELLNSITGAQEKQKQQRKEPPK